MIDPFADSDNSSNRDADYVPDDDGLDDDSDATICGSPVQKFKVGSKFIFGKKKEQPLKACENVEQSEPIQCCEYRNCNHEVFSSCERCLSLLCWMHFDDELAYNNCKNHIPNLIDNTSNNDVIKTKNQGNEIIKERNSNVLMARAKSITENKKVEEQHCEHVNCNQNVQSTCENCFCFLCLDHFHSQDCKDCTNHIILTKTIETKSKRNRRINKENNFLNKPYFGEEKSEQHCEYKDCKKEVCSTCEKCFCLLCLDHYVISNNIVCSENHKPLSTCPIIAEKPILTKDGNFRKRKLYEENKKNREIKKEALQKIKRALRKPCDISCKKKCTSKFSETWREKIHDEYLKLNYESKGLYVKGLVDIKPVKTRKVNAIGSQRKATYVYNFNTPDQARFEVCKTYFLTTLGYDPKNDRRVMSAMNKSVVEQKDQRGNYIRMNKIDRNVIKEHVMKYEPCVSHYRRQHAPNRLYLPSDININLMYKDFHLQHPEIKISSETYRKVVRHDLNISFAHLGHEECEQCAFFKQHNKTHVENFQENCEVCCDYNIHKSNYINSRKEYQKDVEKVTSCFHANTIFYSVDLQKVVMLPRMDQFKAAVFCPRIIAFNESFVPIGSATANNLPFAVVWNETISGRNQEDIISAFRAFLIHNRDVRHIVLWMDNCSAQNKNWALFTFLVDIINSDLISAQTICFKYFEPGHTFMSADSFHHQVELSLQRKNKVYDFDDYVDAVKLSNSKKNIVKVMGVTDFYNYKDLSSQARLRKTEPRCYLKNIMSVKAQRGCFTLKYKILHQVDTELTLDFLILKYKKSQQIPVTEPKLSLRGITESRKKAILEKLVHLMPENRRRFWYDLPISESNEDV